MTAVYVPFVVYLIPYREVISSCWLYGRPPKRQITLRHSRTSLFARLYSLAVSAQMAAHKNTMLSAIEAESRTPNITETIVRFSNTGV